MVQVEISHLTGECNSWREQLRNYREQFQFNESRLRKAAGQQLSRKDLLDVEHLHNQFHIQLINIHDLKQAIKTHDRNLQFTSGLPDATNEETLATHERLHDEYQSLIQTLQDVHQEFEHFLDRTQ